MNGPGWFTAHHVGRKVVDVASGSPLKEKRRKKSQFGHKTPPKHPQAQKFRRATNGDKFSEDKERKKDKMLHGDSSGIDRAVGGSEWGETGAMNFEEVTTIPYQPRGA